MQDRIKVFTFVSGHGETLVDSSHEDHINDWLSQVKGRISHISQSESERTGAGQHVTICVWYVPKKASKADF